MAVAVNRCDIDKIHIKVGSFEAEARISFCKYIF